MTDKTCTASIIVGYKNYCGLVGYKKIEYWDGGERKGERKEVDY